MKVLFICRANAGRSQMAEKFYNEITQSSNAFSAGTEVDTPGETLEERWENSDAHVVEAMDEVGLDVRKNIREPLTPEMLDQANRIIRIVKDEYCPDWLLNYPDVEYWDIPDPKGRGLAEVSRVRDVIRSKVIKTLVNS